MTAWQWYSSADARPRLRQRVAELEPGTVETLWTHRIRATRTRLVMEQYARLPGVPEALQRHALAEAERCAEVVRDLEVQERKTPAAWCEPRPVVTVQTGVTYVVATLSLTAIVLAACIGLLRLVWLLLPVG